MKLSRIYIDTSVIGGCFDPEFAPWSQGLMKDIRMGLFRPVVSEIVTAEVGEAPQKVKEIYQELIEEGAEVLLLSKEAWDLAAFYLKRGILGARHQSDMLHIALATAARVDVLVSWNFKHVVHFDKIRQFNAANLEMGYQSIAIYAPREVTNYGQD